MALRIGHLWNSNDRRRKRQRSGRPAPARSAGLFWDVLEDRLAPAVSTWSGAVSNLWSDAGNWDVAPAAGNDLVFPANAVNLTNVDDLTTVNSFGSLTVAGSGYSISGSAVTLGGTVESSQPSGSNTVALPIDAGDTGPLTVTVDQSGAELVLAGAISGSAGLTLTGAGVLDLTGANSYSGTTTVSSGVLDVDSTQPGSPVTLDAGATLGGGGTVGTITATSATVNPGNPAPGLLSDSGDLNLDSGSTFTAALDGDSAGQGYSQLAVSGQVNLGGATLDASAGFTPSDNESFTIIDNTGGDAVNGTFAGLPQGATLSVSGQPYTISYTGGDGNDVVLTSLVASTTAVASSSSSVVFGQPVTLSAMVMSGDPNDSTAPTGTVEFSDGSNVIDTASLVDGVATLTDVVLPVGTDSITADYLGDTNFAASTAQATTVTVSQASTTTMLEPSATSLVTGQSVTLTANVTVEDPGAGTPTGSVEFFSGDNSLGTATLDANGNASLITSALTTTDTALTVTYGGDDNFTTSTSSPVNVDVSPAGTTTSLTVSPNPSSAGSEVTLTATVVAASPGSGTPTGDVEFFSGSIDIGTAISSGGVATLTTATLSAGSNSITATYTADSNFSASVSPAVTATVEAASSTALSASPTSFSSGQTITLTATVTAASSSATATPTGDVEFFNGSTSLGSAVLSSTGVATLSGVSLTATSTLTATYDGDTNYNESTSAALTVPLVQTSMTTVTTAPNPSAVGQSVTLAAAVANSDGVPTGTVMFLSNGIPLGTVLLDSTGSATLSLTTLPAGSDAITADYSGDSTYAAGTSAAVTQTVTEASATTTLTVAPLASSVGQSVTLSVNVAAISPATGTPTGTVTFLSGSTTLGTATLDANGNASLVTTTLPAGTSSITAQYSGDANFSAGTSAAVSATVSAVSAGTQASTISLSASSTNPSGFTSVTFTATVAPAGSTTTTPTGTVVFFANGAVIGTGTLDVNGTATFSTSDLALGSETIIAGYQGDSNYSGSAATPLAITVGTADELYVNQMYLVVLDRPAEQAGLESWTTALQDGLSREKMIQLIIHSPEGQADAQVRAEAAAGTTKQPVLTPQSSLTYKQERINGLYETILGHPADAAELQFYVNVVNDGHGGQVITVDLLGSDEYYSDITDALQSQTS